MAVITKEQNAKNNKSNFFTKTNCEILPIFLDHQNNHEKLFHSK